MWPEMKMPQRTSALARMRPGRLTGYCLRTQRARSPPFRRLSKTPVVQGRRNVCDRPHTEARGHNQFCTMPNFRFGR
jgi:hypothetical protein